MAVSVWKKNYAHFFVRWAQLNLFTFIFSKQEKENPFFLYYKVISANRITARCLTRTNLFFSNSDPFTQSCGGDRAKVKIQSTQICIQIEFEGWRRYMVNQKTLHSKASEVPSISKIPSLSPISIIPHEYSPVPVSFMEIRKADYYFSKNSNLFLVKRRAADFSSNKK